MEQNLLASPWSFYAIFKKEEEEVEYESRMKLLGYVTTIEEF